jgi:hypothetical protein
MLQPDSNKAAQMTAKGKDIVFFIITFLFWVNNFDGAKKRHVGAQGVTAAGENRSDRECQRGGWCAKKVWF